MCIEKDEMPYRRSRVLICKRFVKYLDIMVLQGSFSVGVYKYARPGSISDWIVVFRVTRDASYDIQSVIEAISAAAQQAPMFLSRRENSNYIASIRSKNGVKKNLVAGILQVMVTDVI